MVWAACIVMVLAAVVAILLRALQIRRTRASLPKGHEIDASILKNGASVKKLEAVAQTSIDYIIVGSGLGALTVASLMSRVGYKVVILEQHDVCGGSTHVFEERGYEWDVGVHYVGGLHQLRRLWDVVTDGALEWSKCDDVYDYAVNMDTEEVLEFSANHASNDRRLVDRFGKPEAFARYWRACAFARAIAAVGFGLKALPLWVARLVLKVMAPLHHYAWGRTTEQVMRRCGLDEDAIGAVTYLFGDYGVPPKEAPFAMHALLDSHFDKGAYYPRGGAQSIAKSIVAALIRRGSSVFVRASVTAIRDGGVECKGVFLKAKRGVICNAGGYNLFKNLLPLLRAKPALDLVPLEPSVALVYVFVGLEGTSDELGLDAANSWMCRNWRHDNTMAAYKNPTDKVPICFLSPGSAKDDTKKDDPFSTVQLLAPVRPEWFSRWSDTKLQHRGAEYEKIKAEWRDRLLEEFLYKRYPKTRGKIRHTVVATPLTTDYYLAATNGANYGLNHSLARFAVDAQLALHTQTCVDNVYLVGQDHVTVGIVGTFMSGFIAATYLSKYAALSAALDAVLAP